jgi:hypothetical protein
MIPSRHGVQVDGRRFIGRLALGPRVDYCGQRPG